MDNTTIVTIEWARLDGRRPRKAGCNARLGEHGQQVRPPLARVTAATGATGFGWAQLTREEAQALVGCTLADVLAYDDRGALRGVHEAYRALEYPILDLIGAITGKPVYRLLGGEPDADGAYRVPCYDTSLYFDDLHLTDDAAAADLIAGEAAEGLARGHRAFKVKIGRGAMHMDLETGTRRDIAVVHAVRDAVGPEARLMVDANNGYNLNLTRRVLAETAEDHVYWIEEPFHEDATLYRHLKRWMARQGLATLIADGEGLAAPRLLDWAREGLIDVVQVDVLRPGFSRWLEVGPLLDNWDARSAPHHYGEPFGNYAAGHLAPAIRRFEGVEWDDATVPALDASAYAIDDGHVLLPAQPGFGLHLDDDAYTRAVKEQGYSVKA